MNYIQKYNPYTSADFCIYPCVFLLLLSSFGALIMTISSFHLKTIHLSALKTFPLLSLKPSLIAPLHSKVSFFWTPRAGVNKYFSLNWKIVNILGFADLVTTIQLCLQQAISYRKYRNKWVWLYSRKTLLMKTGSRLDVAQGLFILCQPLP